jgi:hypothetical protein
MWEGAKCFNVFYSLNAPAKGPKYQINCVLPGFRKDLPLQASVEDAKVFCERMLQRWVAKRGLLFKSHIVLTDSMRLAAIEAGVASGYVYAGIEKDGIAKGIEAIITAALAARG